MRENRYDQLAAKATGEKPATDPGVDFGWYRDLILLGIVSNPGSNTGRYLRGYVAGAAHNTVAPLSTETELGARKLLTRRKCGRLKNDGGGLGSAFNVCLALAGFGFNQSYDR